MRASSLLQKKEVCIVSNQPRTDYVKLDCHHLFNGDPFRERADEYGCWVWIRHDLHMMMHGNEGTEEQKKEAKEVWRSLQWECQKAFCNLYGYEKFYDLFVRDYEGFI